jgi:hypothetical protein
MCPLNNVAQDSAPQPPRTPELLKSILATILYQLTYVLCSRIPFVKRELKQNMI